jgi:hypothetical protein
MVEQAAGTGNSYFDPVAQPLYLLHHAYPTINGETSQAGLLSQFTNSLACLLSQFTRG